MKILFGGPLSAWNTTEARRRILCGLGHDVLPVDVTRFLSHGSRMATRIRWQVLAGPSISRYNRALLEAARVHRPQLVWLELPIQVRRSTVEALRKGGARTLSHQTEYLGFRKYQYRHLLSAAANYDCHVLTNPLSAAMLKQRGAQRVVLTEFGYDPELHHPLELNAQEAAAHDCDAVFVGHWEPSYERHIGALRRGGLTVRVHGSNWNRALSLADRRSIRPIVGQDYVKALVGASIGLGLLSSWNRNDATCRSFEIPATGTFLLAQRTARHASYFTEGKEAEFFDSDEELVGKARRYLLDAPARRAVARAGYERCLSSGHTIRDVTERVLGELG